jgi:hypothetical protein
MPEATLGLRRLYHGPGCSLNGAEELDVTFQLNDTVEVTLRVCTRPRHGIFVASSPRRRFLDEAPEGHSLQLVEVPEDAGFKGGLFTELYITTTAEVSDEFVAVCIAADTDAQSEAMMLAIAREAVFSRAADLISGTIGLFLHPRLILDAVNEDYFAVVGKRFIRGYHTPIYRAYESVTVNPIGISILQDDLPRITELSPEARDLAGDVLRWMRRAWVESDDVTKFLSLFIPLELILDDYKTEAQKSLTRRIREIRKVLKAQPPELRDGLIATLNEITTASKPPLRERFAALAGDAKLVGWEADVEAFRHFNQLRNNLVHRGEDKLQTWMETAGKETRGLQDLVERYVAHFVFEGAEPYLPGERPQSASAADKLHRFLVTIGGNTSADE